MAHSHSIRENSKQLSAVIVVSTLVGAVIALFATPKTGKEYRNDIKKRTRDLLKRNKMKLDTEREAVKKIASDSAKNTIRQGTATKSIPSSKGLNKTPSSEDEKLIDKIRRNGEP